MPYKAVLKNLVPGMDILPLFLSDDEDLLVFSLIVKKKKKKYYRQAKSRIPFNLDHLSDDYCWVHFRFMKNDLLRLQAVLGIPEVLKCSRCATVTGIEALCILLKRLAYPNRYNDIMKFFPRSACELSRISNRTCQLILNNAGHLLKRLDQPWLTIDKVQEFTEALVRHGCPYAECFSFIDGTARPVCRPKLNQREYYNGHKRFHAIKFQSVTAPNGMIIHMSDPIVGRRHDSYLLQRSGILPQLEASFYNVQGQSYHMYGDPAYPLMPHLITPFKAHELTPQRTQCNTAMSKIRESVEWGFKDVIQLFAFLDYKKYLKVGLQPVHQYYLVGALLTNCHCCIYKNQTSIFFNCEPPEL